MAKRYMTISAYAEESGLPEHLVRRLTKCSLADQFCFKSSGASNGTVFIIVPALERMLESGDLKEVLEG